MKNTHIKHALSIIFHTSPTDLGFISYRYRRKTWNNSMLGDKGEETDQTFHTSHMFCYKFCYPHPLRHDMSQETVFALSHIHSVISGKTKPCHSTIKMAEGTRCVKVQKANWIWSMKNQKLGRNTSCLTTIDQIMKVYTYIP